VAGSSIETLTAFFESAEVVRRATRPLRPLAEAGLVVDGVQARFCMEEGRPAIRPEPARDPDFTLSLPAAAVERLTQVASGDVGEMGVAFFQLVLERDPALRVGVRIHASTPRLLSHGYLGVLALGGLRTAMWLLKKGFANPKAAIDRLRGK
jgi:hypothetical protein